MNTLCADLLRLIKKENPQHSSFVDDAWDFLTDEERYLFLRIIENYISDGIELEYICSSYSMLLKETMKELMFFIRNKRYRHSTYEEVAHSVYGNSDYMGKYMVGLALTTVLWKNHVKIHRFFLQHLPAFGRGYLEVGPGHGLNFFDSVTKSDFKRYLGIDVSSTSIDLTMKMLTRTSSAQRAKCELQKGDFLAFQLNEEFDYIVMGEVLEHVEKPLPFLTKAASLLRGNGRLFVSTCINAPEIDHIFLFASLREVHDLFYQAGLVIQHEIVEPYPGKSLRDCIDNCLPINTACVAARLGSDV